jgi:hypothetical protein
MPLIQWAEFKYDFFKLRKLRSKPKRYSLLPQTGYKLMVLFIFTILIIVLLNNIYFISRFPHSNYMDVIILFKKCYSENNITVAFFSNVTQCGPYTSNISASQSFEYSIRSTTAYF